MLKQMANSVIDTLTAINTRRSCRAFDFARKIPRNVIDHITQSAIIAPTGMNAQAFDVLAVTNPAVLESLDKAVFNALDANGQRRFLDRQKQGGNNKSVIYYDAPLVLCWVGNERFTPDSAFVNIDVGISVQSALLAAQSLGVSSVTVGIAKLGSSQIEQVLGLKPRTFMISAAFGYAKKGWKPLAKEILSKVKNID